MSNMHYSGFVRGVFCVMACLLTWFSGSAPAADEAGTVLQLAADFKWRDLAQPPRKPTPHLSMSHVEYPRHDAVEWLVSLNPAANGQTQRVSDIRSADFEISIPDSDLLQLHWNKGSHAEASDFQPRAQVFSINEPIVLESIGGRSSDGVMPYFNLSGDDGGIVVAVGWSGDWRVSFSRNNSGRVRVTAGLKHSAILANHQAALRLPSILIMSYSGDWLAGQNKFRSLMLQHFTPTNHAPMELMPVAASVHGMLGFNDTTESNLTSLAQNIASLHLPLDTFWLDAGWNSGGFPAGQGTLDADPMRFPRGLTPVGKIAASNHLRFLVWYEPERVMQGTEIFRDHHSWLLSPSQTTEEFRYLEKDGFHLLDLGNVAARTWATTRISKHIEETRVGIYRQDANLSPAFFWHTDVDAEGAAMREVQYINGLYQYLDDLMQRHPKLIIDNCAAGGRRLDFEMMRRSVVLWRSDNCWGDSTYPRNVQGMTHGLSLWLPLHGLGAAAADETALKSGMGTCASFAINYRDEQAVNNLQRHLNQYLPVRHLFAKDFYPLTPWTDDPNAWLAFQFHDPGDQAGIVQAFRNPAADPEPLLLKLQGLDYRETYLVRDWSDPEHPKEMLGEDIAEAGVELKNSGDHGTVVLQYAPALKSAR